MLKIFSLKEMGFGLSICSHLLILNAVGYTESYYTKEEIMHSSIVTKTEC